MRKTVFITGGSGAVGGAIVRKFSKDGYKVAFTYNLNKKKANQLTEETDAYSYQAELTDLAQTQKIVSEVMERFGQIDVLVNNAGLTQVMPFALIEEEDWDLILNANLKSMFLVTKEVLRKMIFRKSGVIINVGSLAGHRVLDVPVHYATAKAGVMGFTLSLANEVARYKIRVNSVVPGLLNDGVGKMVSGKKLSDYIDHCMSGRTGTAEEVAETVAFLASDAASYINAQNIFVDGGI